MQYPVTLALPRDFPKIVARYVLSSMPRNVDKDSGSVCYRTVARLSPARSPRMVPLRRSPENDEVI